MELRCKLRSVGVAGSLLPVFEQFLSNQMHCVVDGGESVQMDGVSGVLQDNVHDPRLFVVHTDDMFSIPQCQMVGFADDSTLTGIFEFPGYVRPSQSLFRGIS